MAKSFHLGIEITEIITTFKTLYLGTPEELDKKKLHFWTFQLEFFPTPCRSFEMDSKRVISGYFYLRHGTFP